MRTALLPFLVLAGCVNPRYQASKVVELTLPANGVTALDCWSHNGGVTVTGDAAAASIALRAELSVRGHTQAEADANLELLEVAHDRDGGTLRVRGKYPQDTLNRCSPSFRFTLTVPPQLSLQLGSHNGDLRARGTEGDARFETHNGDIAVELRTNKIAAISHNGDVDLRLDGDGALDGSVISHNGDVTLTLAGAFGTKLQAATHNGRVTGHPQATDTTTSRRSYTGRLGNGAGKLVVDTHNGNVVIR
jgi:hypothetical protein